MKRTLLSFAIISYFTSPQTIQAQPLPAQFTPTPTQSAEQGIPIAHLPATSNTISFDSITAKALSNSYDLKLAAIDTSISKAQVKEARADYFPIFRLSTNSDYQRNLAGTSGQQVAVVNNSVLPGGTRMQNSIQFICQWTAFDAGATAMQLKSAKRDVAAKTMIFHQEAKELKLKIIDLYKDALYTNKALEAKGKILTLQQRLYSIKQRLFQAGQISKVELSEQAIKLADTHSEIADLKTRYAKSLEELSLYTHEKYDPDIVKLEDMRNDTSVIIPAAIAVKESPDYKAYDYLIASKKAQLAALRRQLFPQIVFYASGIFYGSDPNNFGKSVSDISARNAYAGFSITMPLFDGFKNFAQQEKTKLEIKKLIVNRNQKAWQLTNNYEMNTKAVLLTNKKQEEQENVVSQSTDKQTMIIRLADKKVVDQTSSIHQDIELIEQQLALAQTRLEKIAYLKKMYVLAQG